MVRNGHTGAAITTPARVDGHTGARKWRYRGSGSTYRRGVMVIPAPVAPLTSSAPKEVRLFGMAQRATDSLSRQLPERCLPEPVLTKATLWGYEYSWRPADVPEVIAAAQGCGLATV